MANVKNGAMLQCTMGGPAYLRVFRPSQIANILDSVPFVNIPPFGACYSSANPAVATGLATQGPCTPMLGGPWAGGDPLQLVGPPQAPALVVGSVMVCAYGGVITIISPG
jgi:hypothetical protein